MFIINVTARGRDVNAVLTLDGFATTSLGAAETFSASDSTLVLREATRACVQVPGPMSRRHKVSSPQPRDVTSVGLLLCGDIRNVRMPALHACSHLSEVLAIEKGWAARPRRGTVT